MRHSHVVVSALSVALCGVLIVGISAHAGNAPGEFLWQDRFDFHGGADTANAVTANGGRVVAVGSVQSAMGDRDAVVRAYDTDTGALLWGDQVDVAGNDDEALAVVIDHRRVVVLGHGIDGGGNGQMLLRAYHAESGTLDREVRSPALRVTGLAMNHERIVVTGRVVAEDGRAVPYIRAYRAEGGALLWEDNFPSVAAGFDFARRAVAVHGGVAFAAETSHDTLSSRCVVRAYSVAQGGLLWESVTAIGSCRAVATATDGKNVFVAGQTGPLEDDFGIRSFDAKTGVELWQAQTGVPTGRENNALAVDAERRTVFVAGWVHAPQPFDADAFLVRAYDVDAGLLLWEDRFKSDARCFCRARDIVVDKGQVIAVGDDGSNRTWLIRSYEAKVGAVLWHDEFTAADAPSGFTDRATLGAKAVAIDKGRVFVAGSGPNASGDADFIVRAYDAK